MTKRSLDELRVAIDAADSKLLALLNERAGLAVEVGELKSGSGPGSSFYRPARERQVIDRLQKDNPGPFPNDAIRPVFQEVISACLSLEATLRVAYLGPEATFTHQAVRRHFGTSATGVPCGSIPAVFAEVARGGADYGVVPIENSSEGVVTHTLDTFLDTDLKISAEIVVDIEQCLLAKFAVAESKIERVYSHPQALAQCRSWLTANLPHAVLLESLSTADAARAAQDDPSSAAICGEMAARVYHLNVLRRGIQDAADNVTRFLVVGTKQVEKPTAGEDKTSILLVLPDTAGALYDVLSPLSDANVNLTRIESRPTRQKAWDYVFFLDLDGHVGDARIAKVVGQLEERCALFKVLGSYRKADRT